MRRPDQYGDVEGAIAQQAIRVRGDRARVHQPGVRRDQRDELALHVALDACEMLIERRRERRSRAGIPASRHRGFPNVAMSH